MKTECTFLNQVASWITMTENTFINTKKLDVKAKEEPQPQIRVLAEVVYGLSSRNCKGMGICKINAVQNAEQLFFDSPCGSSLAYLQVVDAGRIRVDFLKETINTVQFVERFADGFFLLEEPFSFSPSFTKKLTACGNSLVKGRYPVLFYPEFITIEFTQI